MRVLTVLDSYPPDLNGGAYFTHHLAKSLVKTGIEVLVVCPSLSLKQGYDTLEGVPLYRVRSWPIGLYQKFRVCWPIGIKKGIYQAIETFQPDVIHLQGKFFLGNICHQFGLERNIPMVATNHFMPDNFFHYSFLPKRFEKWFHDLCWKKILRMFEQVDQVTTPTETAARLLHRVGFKKPVEAISCGVNPARFKPNQNTDTLKQQLNIPDSSFYFLVAGRLDKEKNVDFIIKTFAKVNQTNPCHLIITGHGTEKNSLQRLVHQLNINKAVTFTGKIPAEKYPLIYNLSHCLINACEAELQSIVGLEALSSGLPLLVVNRMALPELVDEHQNGYLFEPGSQSQLYNLMMSMMACPVTLQKMSDHSLAKAKPHHEQHITKAYDSIYKSLTVKNHEYAQK